MTDTSQALSFDFDFQGISRKTMFDEALQTVAATDQSLGPKVTRDHNQESSDSLSAKEALLRDLQNHVAELGDCPQLYELKEEYFKSAGWKIPVKFASLRRTHRFFWMQVPMVLSQMENMPFSRLDLAIQFNPAETVDTRKPVSVMIFPDKKLIKQAHFEMNTSVMLNENFELEITTPKLDLKAAQGRAAAGAGIHTKADGGFNFTLGPFQHDLSKLELEHTEPYNSKVFWKVFSAKYLQAERPDFVVVFQIPREVKKLQIAAAMQASHQFDVGVAALGQTLKYLRDQVANFFRQGAPIQDTTDWDLSSLL